MQTTTFKLLALSIVLICGLSACGGHQHEHNGSDSTEMHDNHESHEGHDHSGHDHEGHDHGAESDSGDQSGPEYTSKYICPMHCEGSGSDKKGECPVCGMDYVLNEDFKEE